MRQIEKYYVAVWCLFMPVTSFVLIPAIQGTIIPYILALGSIVFVWFKINFGRITPPVVGYFKSFSMVAVLWLLLLVGSQLSDMVNPLDVQAMFTISGESGLLFRASLFTQSIYLLACVMIALYFRYFFAEAWMKYVYWGAWLFALYGLYDWAVFLVFHQSGDFLANRTFAQGDHPGSWSQTIHFASLELLRLKSCLGEPSFVAAVVIPYLLMAVEAKKKVLSLLLLIAAILTTSTTVYLGMAISLFLHLLWSRQNRWQVVIALGVVLVIIAGMSAVYPDTFRGLFTDKLSGDTESGRIRVRSIDDYMDLFHNFNILNWIFGVGFGYLYFSLGWSLTANTGLLGAGSFLYTLLKPAYLLPGERGSEWLKISMITLLVVILLSVSEMFIPTTWMFIGLAYRRLDMVKARASLPGGFQSADPRGARGYPKPAGQFEPIGSRRAV